MWNIIIIFIFLNIETFSPHITFFNNLSCVIQHALYLTASNICQANLWDEQIFVVILVSDVYNRPQCNEKCNIMFPQTYKKVV